MCVHMCVCQSLLFQNLFYSNAFPLCFHPVFIFLRFLCFIISFRCASTFFSFCSSCLYHRHHDGKEYLDYILSTRQKTSLKPMIHSFVCNGVSVRRRITDFLFILVCVGLPQSVSLFSLVCALSVNLCVHFTISSGVHMCAFVCLFVYFCFFFSLSFSFQSSPRLRLGLN